jgi:hypothetical protein
VAGVVQSFTVTLYDSSVNLLTDGGDQLEITLSQAEIEVFDNHDGSYRVDYLITQAGTYDLTVSVNLDSVNVKTSVITVVPNVPSTVDSTVVFNSVVLIEDQETVIVNVYDSFANEVIET